MSLDDEIREADKIINLGLKELIKTYNIDPDEVKENYLINYANILLKDETVTTGLEVCYKAYEKTIRDYQAIFSEDKE